MGRGWVGVGGLKAETAGNIDRSKEKLEEMQRATGLEAIRMRRNPTHRMEGHRAADHFVVLLTPEISPRAVQFNRFVKSNTGQISGNRAAALGWDAAASCDSLWLVSVG